MEEYKSIYTGQEIDAAIGKANTALQEEQYTGTYSKPNGGIPESDLADAVKQKLNSSGELSNDIKNAILDCFEHVAWIDSQGQDYYDALEQLFFSTKLLVSISALYTQGSATIYPDTPLNDLKSSLVVTAYYSDESTETLSSSDYTLSGTLTVGTSTITVTYRGKITTFNITVSDNPGYISASFNQGNNTIYENASLDDLKQYLTVTYHSDSSSEIITNYTLSGTLEIADTSIQSNSTITVSYLGKTTTFTVNVTKTFNVISGGHSWDNDRTYFGYTQNSVRATLNPLGFALESGKTYSFSIDSAYPTFQLSYGVLNLGENVLELDNKITENVGKMIVENTSYTSEISGWITNANNFTYTADGTYNYMFVSFKKANNSTITAEDINTLKNALTYTISDNPGYISASFNQGNNTIYENASLDDLKQYLTVTYYNGSSSEIITNYTLSGTLEIADTSIQSNSTITVSYLDKTTTFTANVTRTFNVISGGHSWNNDRTFFGYKQNNARATLNPLGFALESGKTYSFSIDSAYPTFQLSYGILNLGENVLELDNKITENVDKMIVENTSYTSEISGWITNANNFTYTADGTYNYMFVSFKKGNNLNITAEDINTLKNALTYTII